MSDTNPDHVVQPLEYYTLCKTDGVEITRWSNADSMFSGPAWDCYTACKAIGDPVRVAEGLKELVDAAAQFAPLSINPTNFYTAAEHRLFSALAAIRGDQHKDDANQPPRSERG